MFHGYQTAQAMRENNEPAWLQFIGLIHDLGKIWYLKNDDECGLSVHNQWALVGDTWICGYPIPNEIVFPQYNKLNPDFNGNSIYKRHVGLNNTIPIIGHDELLYHMLISHPEASLLLPKDALYIIRFHSLYVHHKNNCYDELLNDYDRLMLPMLQKFNKYDLYTKCDNTNFDFEYFNKLILEFISDGKLNIKF